MIAKIISSTGRTNSIATIMYNEKKVNSGQASLLETSYCFRSPIKMAKAFDICNQAANKKTKNVYEHIVLSFESTEKFDNNKYLTIAKDYLESMNYGNLDHAIYLHKDTNNEHIHILTSTIDKKGKKVYPQKDGKHYKLTKRMSLEIVKKLEIKYGLIEHKVIEDPKQSKSKEVKSYQSSLEEVKEEVMQSNFRNTNELNFLLKEQNMACKKVEGNGKTGYIYFKINDRGEQIAPSLKSSKLKNEYGFRELARQMEENKKEKNQKGLEQMREKIAPLLSKKHTGIAALKALAKKNRVGVVVSKSKEGKVIGITFYDRATKQFHKLSAINRKIKWQELFLSKEQLGKKANEIVENYKYSNLYELNFLLKGMIGIQISEEKEGYKIEELNLLISKESLESKMKATKNIYVSDQLLRARIIESIKTKAKSSYNYGGKIIHFDPIEKALIAHENMFDTPYETLKESLLKDNTILVERKYSLKESSNITTEEETPLRKKKKKRGLRR